MFLGLDKTAAGQFVAFLLILVLPAVVSAVRYKLQKVREQTKPYKGFCLSKEPDFSKLSAVEINNRRREYYRRNHGA
jgi:hypothetical protein